MSLTSEDAYLALNLLSGIGPVKVRRLIDLLGSPENILSASTTSLCQAQGIGRELAGKISRWEDHIDLPAEQKKIKDRGLSLLTPESKVYPELLKATYDPPLVLYVWGEIQAKDRHAIGMVGSRRTTRYGEDATKKISFQLAHSGLTVVSGLARGIDTCAHEAALAANGRTIAVIGSGLGQLYPPENLSLAQRIAEGHGAVVSEFPIDCPPDKTTFPLRNRIVAGWCLGICVAEAPVRSGALITARQASEAGRNIYAVPGPIDRPSSEGAHRLIQDGAKLVTGAGDILDDLDTLFPTAPTAPDIDPAPSRPLPELSADERTVLEAMEDEEQGIDGIAQSADLPIHIISASLMRLEMKRLVKQLPGKRFTRLL